MPTTPAWWLAAMVARGVSIQQPTAAPVGYAITGAGTFYATAEPSSDGTKFLVNFGYTMPVERLDRSTGTSTATTLDLGQGYAILDGPNAIWAQFLIQNGTFTVGSTRDQITHFTNAWGDHVTVDETSTLLSGLGDCWAPEKIVIADQHAQASITLQITATPTIVPGTFLLIPGDPSSALPCTSGAICDSATIVITSNINGMNLPQVTLAGYWRGMARGSVLTPLGCPGYDPSSRGADFGVLDWWFMPTTIQAQASDGTSRTTTLNWLRNTDGSLEGQVGSITLSNDLKENFTWGSAVNYSLYSFNPCNGYWSGFTLVSNGVSMPSNPSSFKEPPGNDVIDGAIAPTIIALMGGHGQTPGETILISRVGPYWTGVGDQQGVTYTNAGSLQHVTTILRYPTSSPDSNSAFRGLRLTHPSLDSLNIAAGDCSGLNGYLFATSAILEEEAIYGTGMPDSSGQPSNATVYRTTVYDGFDLHSWANPSGALGTSLPVTAIARRTRIFTPGLPTRTILAGDPTNPAACDDRGPIQTDEWTGPEQSAPSGSNPMSATIASSQVSLAKSAIPGSVHRNGTIQRHFDWSLLRLLTTQDQKTLDGDALSTLRGVTGVDFGITTFDYDTFGRITNETGTRGGYSANEHRDYNGTLPQISATTKTLTGPNGAIYPNPALPSVQAGVSRTFDTTYYQWTATETDKADGRTAVINTRDGLGRVTKQTDVLGTVTDTTYNPWGQVETVTRESKGSVGAVSTTTTYDPNGRWMETTATADGKTFRTHTDYDAFGHAIAVSTYDANGALATSQTFQYDGFGQKTGQSPLLRAGQKPWGTETWAYDPQGRVTDHWDAQNRLLMHVVQQPQWTTISGVPGVWTTTQDDRNFTRSDATDLLGQKLAVVDQKGQLSTYTYDQDGHLIGTNQNGQIRSYTYNAMGWLTDRTEPEEGATHYDGFTLAGTPLVTTQVRPTGTRTFTTTLDAHLQPARITATGPEGTVARTLSYDYSAANTHLLTHLNETQAITGLPIQALSEAYGYDALGRLLSKTISDGDDGFTGHPATVTQAFTVSQTLNDGGQVTSLTYPSGGGKASQTSTIAYDALNRPLTVKLDGALRGMMTYGTPNQTSVTDTLILGNGAQSISVMDKGELVRSEHLAAAGVLEDNALTWTAGGLMTSRGADAFDYDELQRLSHSVVHGVYGETVEQWFQYDRFGNRAQNNFLYTAAGASAQPAEVLAWSGTYGAANQLPKTLSAMGPGDPASSGVTGSLSTGAQYDDLGRMTQVWTTPGQVSTLTTWVYDPSGRVMAENGTTYLLDASGLRFKRAKADGTVDYTVYGFGREPLAQFEIPAPPKTQAMAQATTMKAATRTAMMANSGSLPPDPAGAYILQPTGPVTVAPGQVVSFQGSTDDGTSFTWTFGDGTNATGLTASHSFASVGTYTVVFKASATGYGTTQASVTVTVMAKPSITSFTANPASITAGQSSTLGWSVTGATSLSLDHGIGDVTGTTSRAVTLAVSTTYTLTATNAAGSVTATVTVAVSAPAPPTIGSFTATPSTIAVGSSTMLAWNVTGGASVSISSLGTQSGTSVAVTPAQTTSYTLTATNAAGSATATITVTVETQLPTITDFWANPYQISSGQSATLNWAVSQADSVKLGSTVMTGASASVAPTTTTTYTLTATNLIGSVSATVTVGVGAPGALVWTKTIVYGFGQELAEDQPGMGTTFIQSDFVGSPSFLTNASGAVIGRSKNLPFGERLSSWGQKTIRRYTNHEDDPDSGAIYMQAREQLPAYGKFAQVDPAYDQTKDDPESWNLYNYVTNNPVTHTDPDGRMDANTGGNPSYLDPEYSGPDDPWLPENQYRGMQEDIAGGLAGYNAWMAGVAAQHLFNQAQAEAKEKGKPPVQVYWYDGTKWHEATAVTFINAFINGMNNTLPQAEVIAITEFKKDEITKDFNLVYIPTLGFWHDVFRAIADKLGFTTDTAAQLAVIMQNAPRGTHWFAHSYGGVAFAEAARVITKNGGSLAGDSVAFLAGANNPWVTSGILRGAGVKLIGSGYYDSQWDLVPNVLGLHVVSPLQWLLDIMNGWSLGTRWSPHHAPPMPTLQEINE